MKSQQGGRSALVQNIPNHQNPFHAPAKIEPSGSWSYTCATNPKGPNHDPKRGQLFCVKIYKPQFIMGLRNSGSCLRYFFLVIGALLQMTQQIASFVGEILDHQLRLFFRDPVFFPGGLWNIGSWLIAGSVSEHQFPLWADPQADHFV